MDQGKILATIRNHYPKADSGTQLVNEWFSILQNDVKKGFLLRDLTELKHSSLNLVHYSSLITQMKELKTLEVHASHKLFLLELKSLFEKHVSKWTPDYSPKRRIKSMLFLPLSKGSATDLSWLGGEMVR